MKKKISNEHWLGSEKGTAFARKNRLAPIFWPQLAVSPSLQFRRRLHLLEIQDYQDLIMPIETVVGQEATIHFDASKCIHSRTCVLSHPDVFVPNVQGEWINPDAQPVEELMHIAKSCPSGAISVVWHALPVSNGVADSNKVPLVNTVRIRENGPLAIEAELVIQGKAQPTPRATLCRCGQSKRKPFCDGSHAEAVFIATGEPAKANFNPLPVRNGLLQVEPLPNGPLKVTGNLEIVSGTGRTCNQVTETYLCRCGQSKNKPYCDSSHKAAGFNAP